jgi:hypothetical protein
MRTRIDHSSPSLVGARRPRLPTGSAGPGSKPHTSNPHRKEQVVGRPATVDRGVNAARTADIIRGVVAAIAPHLVEIERRLDSIEMDLRVRAGPPEAPRHRVARHGASAFELVDRPIIRCPTCGDEFHAGDNHRCER